MLPIIDPQKGRGRLRESLWEDSNGWWAEQKLHGCRYLLYSDGRLLSRHSSVKGTGYVDKIDRVPHFKVIASMLPPETVLDGEVVLHKYGNVHEVTSILGSDPDVAVYKQKDVGRLHYCIFDMPFFKGADIRCMSLVDRRSYLDYDLSILNRDPYIHLNRIVVKDKRKFYDYILSRGGEGVILKNEDGLYGQHKYWVKAKRSETFDVFVLGYKEASELSTKVDGSLSATKFAERGWIGAIEMGMYSPADNGNVSVGFCSGFDESTREEISNNREGFIGRVFEIEGQSQFATGRFEHPRFVRWRDDKPAAECMWLGIPEEG